MNTVTPWLVCFGVFLVYPALAFAIGFYVGRRGMPFTIQVKKNPEWGKTMAQDGYGVAPDVQ